MPHGTVPQIYHDNTLLNRSVQVGGEKCNSFRRGQAINEPENNRWNTDQNCRRKLEHPTVREPAQVLPYKSFGDARLP